MLRSISQTLRLYPTAKQQQRLLVLHASYIVAWRQAMNVLAEHTSLHMPKRKKRKPVLKTTLSFFDFKALVDHFNSDIYDFSTEIKKAVGLYLWDTWMACACKEEDVLGLFNEHQLSFSPTFISLKSGKLHLAKIGYVRHTEPLKFGNKILGCVLYKDGKHWYLSVSYIGDYTVHDKADPVAIVGVDVGISPAAVCSDGSVLHLNMTAKLEERLVFYRHKLKRSAEGSNKQKRLLEKIERLERRIHNIRMDAVSKYTTYLARRYGVISLETLQFENMVSRSALPARKQAIKSSSMQLIHHQLFQKAARIFRVEHTYPSSCICSCCGARQPMPMHVRVYYCKKCGMVLDRDLNAATNLAAKARWGTPVVCSEDSKERSCEGSLPR